MPRVRGEERGADRGGSKDAKTTRLWDEGREEKRIQVKGVNGKQGDDEGLESQGNHLASEEVVSSELRSAESVR